MEQHVKMISSGVALFALGGITVYLLTAQPDAATPPVNLQTAQPAPVVDAAPAPAGSPSETTITSAESFYEAANARREQQLIDKAEADRLAKLKAIKERSVECKFWKQQQKTSSAAAKIDEKINEHCNLPSSSAASESSAANESSSATTVASAAPALQ